MRTIKPFILIGLLIFSGFSIANAQECGGSVRTIELQFAGKSKKPEKVSYELFYLAPKVKYISELYEKETTDFVAKFYYGKANQEYQFWQTQNNTVEFLNVSRQKVEKYLKTYKLEDFEPIYSDDLCAVENRHGGRFQLAYYLRRRPRERFAPLLTSHD